jgi:hypothetical protein
MKTIPLFGFGLVTVAVLTAGCEAQNGSEMVVSSDPVLRQMAAELLPALASRSGMELREPVRLEFRSRVELIRYLEFKLDEDLPEVEARARVDAYSLLGLVPADLDLREVLMGLYTEQVAGFYEPDSTALFVLDDQPEEAMEALLMHELVHAVQDQTADLDALTDPDLGGDRATAAQAAIEGHATLVMLEYMTEQMTGTAVDLGQIPDFATQLRPALQAMVGEFPALASAPRVIREGLLFPYLEGAGFVQGLWGDGERLAPFGSALPASTEEVMGRGNGAPPIELTLSSVGADIIHEDVLGRFELGILIEDVIDTTLQTLADAWEGDRYALIEENGVRSVVSFVLWESEAARDRFVRAVRSAADGFGGPVSIDALEIGGRAASALRVGPSDGAAVTAAVASSS